MAANELNYLNSYNKELIFDMNLGAFYVYDMNHPTFPKINDYLKVPSYILSSQTVSVLDNSGNIVVDGSGNPVTTTELTTATRNTDLRKERFKYLVTSGKNVSLAEYKDYTFTDWVTVDGVGANFTSYLITGYNLAGDMARKKQVIYLQVFCKRTETTYTTVNSSVVLANQSSCYVQSQWDWCEDATQGKWGTPFQAYRLFLPQPVAPVDGDAFDYGNLVITTKNKLRGRGDALSLYIYSEAGKDMKLLGWNTLTTINGEP